jgi:hypothetical protein
VEEVKDRDKLGQIVQDMLSKAQPVSAATSNSTTKAAVRKKNTVKTPKKAG